MDLSEYDYLLAQRLLKDRGEELDEDKIKILQNKRIKDISRPNSGSVFMILIGYLLSFLGGVIGIAIGYNYAFHKQMLPNHEQVFYDTNRTSRHGLNILWIGVISFFLWVLIWLISQSL